MAHSGRADVQLQRSLLGEALDEARFAAFVFEEDENYVAVNEAACALTGYTREELLALPLRELSAQPERTLRNLQRVSSGEREGGTAKMRRKDGSVIDVRYRASRTSIAGMPFLIAFYWTSGAAREP
jgi:PAS domain S-box-containing protein